MSYDEHEQRRSRVVVETPAGRTEREVVHTEHVPERRGFSTGAVAAMIVGAVALVTILFLFLLKNQDNTANDNLRTTTTPAPVQQQPQPVIVQQPAPVQQAPIVVQQPATTQPAPVIVTPPASSGATQANPATTNGTDDATIQQNVDKKIADDTSLASAGILVMVIDGKATITGTVASADLKSRAERAVNSVRGVHKIDNQIIVSGQ